jgi:hypothetical protein
MNLKKRKNMKKQIIISALAGLALAACTNDDNFADFTGPVELNFSGEVSTVQTRATAEEWTSVHSTIGVTATQSSAGTSYQNKKYSTTDITDGSAPTEVAFKADEADKFYFGSPKETATFAAYSPYVADEKVSSNLVTVSADDSYNVTDYLFATTSSLNYSTASSAKLTFQHKMAQIKVVVKLSDEVSNPVTTDDNMGSTTTTYGTTLTQVELSNLITDGTFNITTGETALTSGATAKTITKSIDGSSTIEAELGEYIILPTDKKNLVVTLTTTDVSSSATTTYQATLDDELKAGNSYTFTVTAKKSGLSVEGVIQPWTVVTDGSLTAGMIRVIQQFDVFDDPSLTQRYDLAFSDGTFMRIVDAEGKIPTDISADYLTDDLKEIISGIVYWTGDVTQDDPILAKEKSNCTHGLIMALDYVALRTNWQTTYKNIYTDFQSAEGSEYSTSNGYVKILVGSANPTGDDLIILNTKLGYNNTCVLRAYNSTVQDTYKVNPILELDKYTRLAPTNSSGWYLPSLKELALLLDDKVDLVGYPQHNIVSSSENLNNIMSILTILKGKSVSTNFYLGYNYLSSSLYISYNANNIYSLDVEYYSTAEVLYNGAMSSTASLPVCAF